MIFPFTFTAINYTNRFKYKSIRLKNKITYLYVFGTCVGIKCNTYFMFKTLYFSIELQ